MALITLPDGRTVMERGILFTAPMVRAIREGRKTQTRRLAKLKDGSLAQSEDVPCRLSPDDAVDYLMDFSKDFPYWRRRDCLYGEVGDRLWVRETCRAEECECVMGVRYPADDEWIPIKITEDSTYQWDELYRYNDSSGQFVPSIHMPRWASRTDLENVGIRIERVQDISEADAIAEGIEVVSLPGFRDHFGIRPFPPGFGPDALPWPSLFLTACDAYAVLWDQINGKKPGCAWRDNPWVWVVEFKEIK